MTQKKFELTTKDGLKLYGQAWLAEQPAQAVVVIVHGLGEHLGRYAHVAEAFTENGIHVYGFDQRGFGRSEGLRGHTPSFQHLMDDIYLAIQHARQDAGEDLPLFLYGHSLGGLEVLYFGLRSENTLSGVIATNPGLDLSNLSQANLKIAKIGAALLPKIRVTSGLDTDGLSRDPEVVKVYLNDPLVHNKASLMLANEGTKATGYVLGHAADWKHPLLLMHGTADRVVSIKGTDSFFKAVSGDVTYKRWEGLFHELHNEPEKEEVIQVMVDWIKSRV